VVPAEPNITMVDAATASSRLEEISPMEMTIEETLKLDERKKETKRIQLQVS
jgi:cell division protein FtsZ